MDLPEDDNTESLLYGNGAAVYAAAVSILAPIEFEGVEEDAPPLTQEAVYRRAAKIEAGEIDVDIRVEPDGDVWIYAQEHDAR